MKPNTRADILIVSHLLAQTFLLVLVMAVSVVALETSTINEKLKGVLLLFSDDQYLPARIIVERPLRFNSHEP